MGEQGKSLPQTKPVCIPTLYTNYAAMLLGYINQVVKDTVIAEEYLLKTFNTIAKQFKDTNWNESNNWVQLLRFARAELTPFHQALKGCEAAAIVSTNNTIVNNYLDKMTDEQKHVFCSIYYHQKTTAGLSKEINKSEELVKGLLKEALSIIKEINEN